MLESTFGAQSKVLEHVVEVSALEKFGRCIQAIYAPLQRSYQLQFNIIVLK